MKEYYLYHDESKEQGFWHGFLLVPVEFRDELAGLLDGARQNNRLQKIKMSFKNISKPPHFVCAKTWFTLLLAALQNERPRKMVEFFWGSEFGDKGEKAGKYRTFSTPPGCKASMFYFPQGAKAFTYSSDYTGQFASAFKVGAKHLLNTLLPPQEPCIVRSIFIDGEEHFKPRSLPKEKLLDKLKSESKSHISFADDCTVNGVCVPEKDRLILDALDVFLGAFRYSAKVISENATEQGILNRMDISKQGNKLIKYMERHPAGKINSRFYRGIAMSEAVIESGAFHFNPLSLRMIPCSQGVQEDFYKGQESVNPERRA